MGAAPPTPCVARAQTTPGLVRETVAAPFFWDGPLRSAVIADGATITPDRFESMVAARAAEIGPGRLVLLHGSNDLEFVVSFVASLRAGSPVIVGGSAAAANQMVEQFDPDVVIEAKAAERSVQHRRLQPAHDLHPDLALMLSTSGSTGSPRLVRLSRRNVAANAASIARYLELRADDRTITSLPLHYCYGLSVLTSHLVAGATVALTELSVVDQCFWALAREV